MKFPFSGIFGMQRKAAPKQVTEQLLQIFPEAINIDWELKGEDYEAVFYLNDVEHIAKITKQGKLTEYKKNLWPGELPETIAEQCSQHGEIMNAIAIQRGNEKFFEIIIRNKEFNRSLFLFSQNGTLIEKRGL